MIQGVNKSIKATENKTLRFLQGLVAPTPNFYRSAFLSIAFDSSTYYLPFVCRMGVEPPNKDIIPS